LKRETGEREWFRRDDRKEVVATVAAGIAGVSFTFLWILLPTWVYVDGTERGVRRARLFAFLTVLSSLIGLVVYLIARPEGGKALVCPGCAREVNGGSYCPHCGRDLSSAFCGDLPLPPEARMGLLPLLPHRDEGPAIGRGGGAPPAPRPLFSNWGRGPSVHPAGGRIMNRPLVAGLFVSSTLLSVVSWYTTQQGMALYLSPWFSFLASLGVQSALVLVAWLVGVTESRRGLLVAVYAVTAAVSIAFSYVSLHTWFASKERPATIERALYDELVATAGKSQELLTAAIAEGQRHVLSLEEMTAAEKAHGYISKAIDQDPYLSRVREAVAREPRATGPPIPRARARGSATRPSTAREHRPSDGDRLQQAQRAVADFQAG
jgi:hypothetical protein